jgi:hypothetical protein
MLNATEDIVLTPMHSDKIATLLAYSQLLVTLEQYVGTRQGTASDQYGQTNGLTWTDSKQGLVELIYSLKEQGAFNSGSADIKSITQFFEKTFGVQLGNTSSMFQKILSRKTGQTHYIDQLKKRLSIRIDDIDERPLDYD